MTELKVMENVDINGREFTRILGGFREDGKVVSKTYEQVMKELSGN